MNVLKQLINEDKNIVELAYPGKNIYVHYHIYVCVSYSYPQLDLISFVCYRPRLDYFIVL